MHAEPVSWSGCSRLADLDLSHLGTYQRYFIHGPTHLRLPLVNGQGCVPPESNSIAHPNLSRYWGFQHRNFSYETEGRWDESRTWDKYGAALPQWRTTALGENDSTELLRGTPTATCTHPGTPNWGVPTGNHPWPLSHTAWKNEWDEHWKATNFMP